MATSTQQQLHPYYPKTLELPGFAEATMTQSFILATFGSFSVILVFSVWAFAGTFGRVSKLDKSLMCWFAFCGFTHIVLEGYFAFDANFYTYSVPNFLAEVWKEYSKADSRYVGRDSAIVCVEGLTAVLVGPGCLLSVYAIGAKTTYQHTLQLVISVAQLYGDLVYFITVILDGEEIGSPEPVYFWFYFIFMNGIWIVVPLCIAIRSWLAISKAFESKKKKK
ncbi:unnamed protein product [Sphagnum compactum]